MQFIHGTMTGRQLAWCGETNKTGFNKKEQQKRTLVEPLRAHPMTHISQGHSNKILRPESTESQRPDPLSCNLIWIFTIE